MKENFLWGSSISAGQCEGGFSTRGMTVVDNIPQSKPLRFKHLNNPGEYIDVPSGVFYPSQVGVEFYEHYQEDIARFAEMGFKALRISCLWSRVFPDGDNDVPNEAGLEFYDNVINELVKHNITPIITLVHFDMPLWVVKDYDGFRNRHTVDLYIKFAKVLINRYKDRVKHWISFCEINVMNHALYMVGGTVLKEHENRQEVLYQCAHHEILATCLLVKVAHEIDPDALVSCEVAGTPHYPLTSRPDDYRLMVEAERSNYRYTDALVKGKYPYYMLRDIENNNYNVVMTNEDLEVIKNYNLDFIAVSYYKTEIVSVDKSVNKNPYLEQTKWDWTIDAKGFGIMLNNMYERYEIPILVVENGLGTSDELIDGQVHDDYRINYLREHIIEMKKAINEGVDVMGYLTWAAMDVVSTSEGQMSKRYGFVYVDRNDDGSGTLKRFIKDSFHWYKKVIASDGEDLEI